MTLLDRIAIVTGASRGIGKGIASVLAREGANVVIADIDIDAATKVSAQLQATHDRKVLAFQMDVSCKAEVLKVVESTIDRFGRIDILVNNAGICQAVSIEELKEEDWDRTIDVNLKGVFLCSQSVIAQMRKQGGGKIVNIASLAGKIGGMFCGPDYAASKAGVICLTRSFAKNLAKDNILVNAVSPGTIMTDLQKGFPAELNDKILDGEPLGRFGEPEDIGEAVAFLCSDKARWITGEIFDVDGGEGAFYQLER